MKNEFMSDRINQRMQALGLRSTHLMDATGASKGTVSQWVNGGTAPSAKFISKLAEVLGVSERWLTEGGLIEESKGNAYPGPDLRRRVPLLSSVQAGSWKEIVEGNLQDVNEWIETTAKVSPYSFSLRVSGDSMDGPPGQGVSIPNGSIVIVDPEVEALNGRIVVARVNGSNEATVKKLAIDGPNIYLMPLNPNFKPIPFDENCVIIGVCVRVEMNLL
ncbi:LexA family protein [Serratia marcescens]|jgi:SOS-response transcriptional repressor LexA|uniref:LexA family protein n=1 Tax=Serratia marcescens TaxID=615 RepID=UPI00062C6020|nr:LexA family transcriptional regulator [Serratia marcescens]KKZ17256.1 XRE family transcriptional regulator [Serratia marcescens]MCX2173769.1 LexA family transcriptional regulator [Serratia marcescens]MCX2176260.1 LexA family transcriptional regulator [Serratia marcescens]MDU0858631.1 LexA family transcriptional regulator [Serratia marcescens]